MSELSHLTQPLLDRDDLPSPCTARRGALDKDLETGLRKPLDLVHGRQGVKLVDGLLGRLTRGDRLGAELPSKAHVGASERVQASLGQLGHRPRVIAGHSHEIALAAVHRYSIPLDIKVGRAGRPDASLYED